MVPIEYYQHQKLNGNNNMLKSKRRSSDQELIQSNPTSHPQNKKGKNTHTHKLMQEFRGMRRLARLFLVTKQRLTFESDTLSVERNKSLT